jgi:quercetin dioxygenase-like cupin family protein
MKTFFIAAPYAKAGRGANHARSTPLPPGPVPPIIGQTTGRADMRFTRIILGAAIAAGLCAGALAQDTKATVNDPVGPMPDPSHVPSTLPKDIKCTGTVGKQQMCYLFGDPTKPGLYGVIYKWYPGNFSHPHFHDQMRYAYVISGTWWVSTSNVYDEKKTYPVHAGTVAIDNINTVHWDGCREGEKEPAILELVGMGPVKTIQVDETGKAKPGQ